MSDPKTEAVKRLVEEGHWIIWETRQKHLREAALRLWDAAQAAMPCYDGQGCDWCPACTAGKR